MITGVIPSVFCSPKAVSRGGPNKAVESSLTGVCWLMNQKRKIISNYTYFRVAQYGNFGLLVADVNKITYSTVCDYTRLLVS